MTLTVADRLALTDLVHRYAAGIDETDLDTVVGLFTADGELVLPDPPDVLTPVRSHRGPQALRTALAAATRVGRTHHSIASEVYRAGVTPDTAHGRIAAQAHHWSRRDDSITDLVWYLHYVDDYARADSGWLLARRRLVIDAIETHSARRLR